MEINSQTLLDLHTSLQANFATGLASAQTDYPNVAMVIRSTTKSNTYPDFDKGWPTFRKWVGDRAFAELSAASYQIFNETYESSLKASREDIEDDVLGFLAFQAQAAGQAAPQFIDELLWTIFKDGNKGTNLCHDGNPFFSDQHKGKGAAKQSNIIKSGTAGAPIKALLLDTKHMFKPGIVQLRRDFALTSKVALTDDNVFHANEFQWGIDGRLNCGYGPWFTAVGSEEGIDAAVYKEMRLRHATFKSQEGRPYRCTGNLLVVGPSQEQAALEVLKAERNAAGATNIWRDTATLLVTPYLD